MIGNARIEHIISASRPKADIRWALSRASLPLTQAARFVGQGSTRCAGHRLISQLIRRRHVCLANRFASGGPLVLKNPMPEKQKFASRINGEPVLSLPAETNRLTIFENQNYGSRVPIRNEGRTRRHERWVGMRWTCWRRRTSDGNTDGEVVWSWRPLAGAKPVR